MMNSLKQLEQEVQELFNAGNNSETITYLENILNGISTDEHVKNKAAHLLGRIHYYNNEYPKAEDYFNQALSCDKHDVYSRLYIGLISEAKGNIIDAIRIYSSCIETNPDLDHLKYRIQKLSLELPVGNELMCNLINEVEKNARNKERKVPLVSIIVLCYNKVEYTKKCLKAIYKNTKYPNIEVVVVDNASFDETPSYLEAYGDKIKFVHSEKNLGFVGGNNAAYEFAEGDYLVFLNNDTEVTPNWLKYLYNTFIIHPDAGAVGSMLIYPNGVLQEAGGVIFNDATGWNWGKQGDKDNPSFTFLREVDYCSGAALMVRRNLFEKHGEFDERFAPAYFEDTDLCFGIRKLGYKVYYCPLSKVIHHEGITAGTDLSKGFKKFQVINTPKFIEKWKTELKQQYPPDAKLRYFFSNRKEGKRILIIDDIPPFPDRAAGALRHYHTLKQMLNLGYQVTYIHLIKRGFTNQSSQKYFDEFKMRGVEFHWFQYETWWHFRESSEINKVLSNLIDALDLKLRNYDLVYIAFWHIAEYFIDLIRNEIPSVPILVDTMDVHYLREIRQAELSGDKKMLKEAEHTKKRELALYAKADCITTVTENDRDVLKKELPNKSIVVLTDVHDAYNSEKTFDERKDFLFIGNFNHTPNTDAVFYFVEKIFPLIKKKIKDAKFYIVGNNPTPDIQQLASNDIVVTGWVPEVRPYLEQCRVSVVPLRFGAGNKGKVGETLSHGLPVVSTTIGAEGMGIVNEVHSFVIDDPVEFADYAVRLHSDKNTWEDFAQKGKDLVTSQYSSELMRKRLQYIMSYESREAFTTKQALSFPNPPEVSIILITYNQYEYTKKCLLSLREYTNLSHEIIIVDNNSSDKTVELIKKEFPEVRLIENKSNLGFPKAVNQGISITLGNYVLLLNNDTILTQGWLERMVEVAEMNKNIGLVGPISNEVSGVQIDKEAKYKTIEEMHEYAAKIKEKNKNVVEQFPRVAFLCTLIRKEVIDKIGGLDERFSPGNFEDDDFCLRAQLAGYKTVIAKDVFIHHFGSVSFKANGTNEYAGRLDTNKQKFVQKWGGTAEDIWLEGKQINKRSIKYSINKDKFSRHFERTLQHLEENEFNLASTEIEEAIKSFQFSSRTSYTKIGFEEVLNLAGKVAFLNGDLEKAKQYYEQQLNQNPASSSACQGLGEVFSIMEMTDEAKSMFEWAVKNDLQNKEAVNGLAKVNLELGLPENDNSLMEFDPREIIANAENLIEEEKYEEAKTLLAELLEKEPNYIDAMNDLSVVYSLEGDFSNALQMINKILSADPNNEIAKGNFDYINQQLEDNV